MMTTASVHLATDRKWPDYLWAVYLTLGIETKITVKQSGFAVRVSGSGEAWLGYAAPFHKERGGMADFPPAT